MKTFKDLTWRLNPVGGVVGTVKIANNMEISVAMGPGTYGGNIGQWEICVFKGETCESVKLKCLDGGDVQGWLSTAEAEAKMDEIEKEVNDTCWLCHGYGELKSHSDAPDRICPACDGTGKNKHEEITEEDL